MTVTASLEGWKECREALQEFSTTIQKNVGKRALRVPAEMVADATRTRAPVSTGRPDNPTPGSLRASVQVVAHKSRVGASLAVLVEDPAAIPNEYGTTKMSAQPFMRPAVQAVEAAAIAAFEQALKSEVEAAARRAAKRSKAAGT